MMIPKNAANPNAAKLYRIKPRAPRCTIPADQLAAAHEEQGGFRAGRSLRVYGARTRREFLALKKIEERARG